jgi:AcrR family transcriptional regulator
MSAPDRKALRREKLLDAAERVFGQQGLRGATMEAIAAEARVAKATAYAYFRDKEDAFRLVAERLAGRLAEAVETGLASSSDPRAAVIAALQAKELIAWRAAHASVHAHDLLSAKTLFAAEAFTQADDRVRRALGARLGELGVDAADATARRLVSACAGLAGAARDEDALAADITHLAGAVLAGLAPERS